MTVNEKATRKAERIKEQEEFHKEAMTERQKLIEECADKIGRVFYDYYVGFGCDNVDVFIDRMSKELKRSAQGVLYYLQETEE